MSYVSPGEKNSKKRVGTSPTVPRDAAPHGVQLGTRITPQTWTILMTSANGDFELTGSHTGRDGTVTFDVRRSVVAEVSFKGTDGERISVRLAQALKNDCHTLELVPLDAGEASLEAFKVYQPPLDAP
jgi:hypothetical protein